MHSQEFATGNITEVINFPGKLVRLKPYTESPNEGLQGQRQDPLKVILEFACHFLLSKGRIRIVVAF